jgi:hypothetical protein
MDRSKNLLPLLCQNQWLHYAAGRIYQHFLTAHLDLHNMKGHRIWCPLAVGATVLSLGYLPNVYQHGHALADSGSSCSRPDGHCNRLSWLAASHYLRIQWSCQAAHRTRWR